MHTLSRVVSKVEVEVVCFNWEAHVVGVVGVVGVPNMLVFSSGSICTKRVLGVLDTLVHKGSVPHTSVVNMEVGMAPYGSLQYSMV